MAQEQGDRLTNFRNQILVTGVLAGLAQLPNESIDCVVTSPPYWGLRDYGIEPLVWDGDESCEHEWRAPMANPLQERRDAETMKTQGAAVTKTQKSSSFAVKDFGKFCAKCTAWRGSLGLEPTIDQYLTHLVAIFDEIHRVLKPTGTCWVNLGDCYSGGWGLKRSELSESNAISVPQKSLCLIPHRFTIGMVERGWMLRNHIVWHKPNHMPASVRDRFANAWDHVFMFAKAKRYYFDLDAVRVPHRSLSNASRPRIGTRQRSRERNVGPQRSNAHHARGKNPGDCWHIASHASPYAHFATFPERLVEMPIKAGCAPLTCVRCGLPKRQVHMHPPNPNAFDMQYRDAKAGYVKLPGRKPPRDERVQAYNDREHSSRGGPRVIAAGCGCRRPFLPGVVLDPFMGTGTTAVVAQRHVRDFVGFEISDKYAEMARGRLKVGTA